ncbi:ArnT family glycosyltransferase [Sulfitobacter pontiacus]|uniref:ArnT family glycosyltransferase n=1 Tax=Sulfitobacter pontiacus TaxID=60137 RepID=UPI0030EF0F85
MVTLDTNIPAQHPSVGIRGSFGLTLQDRRFLIAALLMLLAIRLLFMLWLPFTDTTEARYAEIARKMIETGDWITPQFDYDVPFWGKPPLHTWFSALGMQIFGVGGFGARIFILLSGLSVLGLTGVFMKRYVGAEQALVAFVALLSSVLFFGASAFVMTDMVMTLGITLSMVAFFTQVTDQTGQRIWGHLFFVGLAVGLLAKGPVALVLTLMPIGLWILLGRRWSLVWALPWRTGMALLLALTLPWYIAAELKTPGFLRYFLIGEHFERFTVSGWQGDLYGSGHARAKGLIWLYWIAAFLPWTLFAGWLVWRVKKIAKVVREDTRGWHSYLLLWALAPMLLFTPAANILAAYTLPGMPAAVLLLVSLWSSVQGPPGRAARTVFGVSIGVVTALFATITLLSKVAPEALNLKSQQALVTQALEIDPQMRVSYWGGRSYSAEFYTAGKAQAITDTGGLAALASDDVRDAVAVSPGALDHVSEALGQRFTNLGKFGRNFLFVEAGITGEKP